VNVALACRVLDKLVAFGVSEVCVCAGARNAPLLVALAECRSLRVWNFFEERSAAFFAVGRSWSLRRTPVAVMTTSGTAAGELLPAMMEAHYAGIPLVAITADRPRIFRGSGAPQSAEQAGLFSCYAKGSFDLESIEEADRIDLPNDAPSHINVCFSEPLLDGPARANFSSPAPHFQDREISQPDELATALAKIKRPLLILSHQQTHPLISELLERANCLVYAEAASQHRVTSRHLLRAGAEKIPQLVTAGAIDGVIRVGGVPTLRFWRDLEDRFDELPVVSISSPPFSGLARSSDVFQFTDRHLEALIDHLEKCDASLLAEILEHDARDFEHLDKLLARHPHSEPAWLRRLSENIPDRARIFLGNSLPIREWDLAATYSDKQFAIHCSRGLNGIDGQLSAFFGWANSPQPNLGILGDLTTLYDLAAPWILKQRDDLEIKIVVINNRGGRIFDRMFGDQRFLNAHDLNFESWARFWSFDYAQNEAMMKSKSRRLVVEITPDAEATRAFWREHSE
jgi:2-succinyl-5-enolpyruvyl-6-hydroxy-3-cyclohexene-1-carboxylate synthase